MIHLFTGIIEELGTYRSKEGGNRGSRLAISARRVVRDLAPGDSIAVNGVCLTATRVYREGFEALAAPEKIGRAHV